MINLTFMRAAQQLVDLQASVFKDAGAHAGQSKGKSMLRASRHSQRHSSTNTGAESAMVVNDTERYISGMWLQAVEVSRRRIRHQRHQKTPRLWAVEWVAMATTTPAVKERRKTTSECQIKESGLSRKDTWFPSDIPRDSRVYTRCSSDRRRLRSAR